MKLPQFKTLHDATVALGVLLGGIYYLEGNELTSYPDAGGIYTVCAGITTIDGHPVQPNLRLTEDQCRALNTKAVDKEKAFIESHAPKDTPEEVKTALVWYVYNIGEHEFLTKSSVYPELKKGNYNQVCTNLLRKNKAGEYLGYIHVHGRVNQGLVYRRSIEQIECRKGLK